MKGLWEKNKALGRVMIISVPDALLCVTFWMLLGFLEKLVKLWIKLYYFGNLRIQAIHRQFLLLSLIPMPTLEIPSLLFYNKWKSLHHIWIGHTITQTFLNLHMN